MPLALTPLALGAAALMCLAGCEKDNQYQPPTPPKVSVAKPRQEAVTEYLELTGQTESVATVDVVARVEGFLTQMLFEEGAAVEKGDLLYEIDPREFEAEVRRAEAAVATAKSARDLAQARLERLEEAVKTDAVSKFDVIEARAVRDQGLASVLAAEANLVRAQLDLSYTKIRAPMSGHTGETLVDPGNLVGGGENTLLTRIVQYDPIYVRFDISERDLLRLMDLSAKRDDPSKRYKLETLRAIPVELALADDEGYPTHGNMWWVDQQVDRETGTLPGRARYDNPRPTKIFPGMFARIRMPVRKLPGALIVPDMAVLTDQQGRYVLVVDGQDEVSRQRVSVGRREGRDRVILDGLKPSDRVVVNGLQRARPGAKVTPVEPQP